MSKPDISDATERRSHVRALVDSARHQASDTKLRLGRDSSPSALGDIRVFPGYEITAEIYRGGQGVVYQARQSSTGRTVAIKVMREGPFAGEAGRIRFEREVSILAQLDHRNIIGILDRGLAAGSQFLVMDYVDGLPLDRHARESGLALEKRLLLFAEVCDAVNAAHLRGVIHRDLKPSNILVDKSGEPRILDFGLAKMAGGDEGPEHGSTQTGQFVGSLPWVSPEQARGLLAEVDIRSDVYSLGVILYQLLTDRLPYSTVGDLEKILTVIRTVEPVRPRTLSSEIDDDLETIALKSLAKEPSRRYQSVGELARDVRHYLANEPIEAKRDSATYLFRKTLHRHRGTVAASAAFVLLLAAATVLSLWLWRRAATQRDEAVAATHRETVARQRASSEASKATQIAQFAQGMLSGIDPATAGDMDKRLMRLVLDGSAKRVDTELSAQPEVQAAVRRTIGKAYQAIGELGTSQIQLEKALATSKQVLGDDHLDTLRAQDDLAMLYDQQANFPAAERLCRTALVARGRVLGPDHRETILSKSNLAEILTDQGRFAEAETLNREVLEQRIHILGSDDPETLTTLNNLAGALRNLQRFDEAERLFKQTIEGEKRVKGKFHPHTLRTMSSLGLLYQESGKLPEAEASHREVLALRRQVLGDEHPDTTESLVNLAIVLRANGHVDDAEKLLRQAIDVERRTLGSKHTTLAGTLFILSSIVGRKGDLAQAEKLIRETLSIYEASLPADHSKVLTTRIGLGTCLARMGKYEDAEQLLLKGNAAIQNRTDVSADWKESSVRYLVQLYDAWNAAAPNTGKSEKAERWRQKLPNIQPAATTQKL